MEKFKDKHKTVVAVNRIFFRLLDIQINMGTLNYLELANKK